MPRLPECHWASRLVRHLLYGCVMILCLWGCATLPSSGQRLQAAEQLATSHDWRRNDIKAPPFLLTSFLPPQPPQESSAADKTLTVYIEGDGLAWRSGARVSDDPSPVEPLGLRLALSQPFGRAAYLARPCQYTASATATAAPGCQPQFWTSHRFAPEVIAASSKAISTLMSMTSSTALRLVGYSGGGAVAALVAAQRRDVVQLITVAGNLDHAVWTQNHAVSPLSGSLNPADAWQALAAIPQLHLIGDADEIVDAAVTQAYQNRFPKRLRPEIRLFPNHTHNCCWVENWPEIYKEIVDRFSR